MKKMIIEKKVRYSFSDENTFILQVKVTNNESINSGDICVDQDGIKWVCENQPYWNIGHASSPQFRARKYNGQK